MTLRVFKRQELDNAERGEVVSNFIDHLVHIHGLSNKHKILYIQDASTGFQEIFSKVSSELGDSGHKCTPTNIAQIEERIRADYPLLAEKLKGNKKKKTLSTLREAVSNNALKVLSQVLSGKKELWSRESLHNMLDNTNNEVNQCIDIPQVFERLSQLIDKWEDYWSEKIQKIIEIISSMYRRFPVDNCEFDLDTKAQLMLLNTWEHKAYLENWKKFIADIPADLFNSKYIWPEAQETLYNSAPHSFVSRTLSSLLTYEDFVLFINICAEWEKYDSRWEARLFGSMSTELNTKLIERVSQLKKKHIINLNIYILRYIHDKDFVKRAMSAFNNADATDNNEEGKGKHDKLFWYITNLTKFDSDDNERVEVPGMFEMVQEYLEEDEMIPAELLESLSRNEIDEYLWSFLPKEKKKKKKVNKKEFCTLPKRKKVKPTPTKWELALAKLNEELHMWWRTPKAKIFGFFWDYFIVKGNYKKFELGTKWMQTFVKAHWPKVLINLHLLDSNTYLMVVNRMLHPLFSHSRGSIEINKGPYKNFMKELMERTNNATRPGLHGIYIMHLVREGYITPAVIEGYTPNQALNFVNNIANDRWSDKYDDREDLFNSLHKKIQEVPGWEGKVRNTDFIKDESRNKDYVEYLKRLTPKELLDEKILGWESIRFSEGIVSYICEQRNEHFIILLRKYRYCLYDQMQVIEKICRMKQVNFETCTNILEEILDRDYSHLEWISNMLDHRKEELGIS